MFTRTLLTLSVMSLLLSCHMKKKSSGSQLAAETAVSLGGGTLPRTLEETGLFLGRDLRSPAPGVQPYEVRVPLWSDGARKDRFVFIPKDQAIAVEAGKIILPRGSVLVKHFRSEHDPAQNIETRLIALNKDGTWSFGTYVWNPDGTTELLEKSRTVRHGADEYRIPSAKECTSCHRSGSEVLGYVPMQLKGALQDANPLPDLSDSSVSLETRARAYLHVNCSVCHNPDGPAGANVMDMRRDALDTKLLGLGKIFPGNPEASPLFQRISAEASRMPPTSIRPDPLALDLFRAYISGLPVPKAPEPPEAPAPEDRDEEPVEQGPQQSDDTRPGTLSAGN